MKKRRNYTVQKREHAISLVRRSGWSYLAVARLIGCATTTVKYWCRKNGVASIARPGRPRKIKEENDDNG